MPADKSANNAVVVWEKYYINTLNKEHSTAKTYEHNLPDERSVFDRQRCPMTAKFGVFNDEDHSKLLRNTGYQTFIKDPISHVLLLILAHVLLLNRL